MKKKFIIIITIIITIFILGIIFKYYDSARVRAGHEPKLVIKTINEDGNKVTYWGLGYKVIRYPSVSPNEPYKNNRGVKFGSWFMKYELKDNNYQIKEIVDTTREIKDFVCAEALEQFYEDDNYTYYYSCIKSSYVIVKYTNGEQQTVEVALKNNNISIKDLDEYKIKYYKYEK